MYFVQLLLFGLLEGTELQIDIHRGVKTVGVWGMIAVAMVRGRGWEVQITFHAKRNDNFTCYSAIIISGFDVKTNQPPFTEIRYSFHR